MRLHVYVLEVLREFFLHLRSFSTEGGSCSDRFCSGQSRPPPHPPPSPTPGTVWSIIFMNIYFFVQINYSSCTSFRLTVHCLERWYIFWISGHNCLRNRTLLNWKLNFPFFVLVSFLQTQRRNCPDQSDAICEGTSPTWHLVRVMKRYKTNR